MASRNSKESKKAQNETSLLTRSFAKASDKQIYEQSKKTKKEQEKLAKMRSALDEVWVEIKGDTPIAVMFLSDLHIGNDQIDDNLIEEMISGIKEMNAAVIFLGDEIEGSTQYNSIQRHQIGGVEDQIRDLKIGVLDEIWEHVIGAYGEYFGHPGWTTKNANIKVWGMMFDEYGIPILKNAEGIIYIVIGNAVLKVNAAHYFRRKSSIDILHGQREHAKAMKGDKTPDVVAGAHYHNRAIGTEHYPQSKKSTLLIQSGTAKIEDEFGNYIGSAEKPAPGGQGFIITRNGNTHGFESVEKGKRIYHAIDFAENSEPLAREATEKALSNDDARTIHQPRKSTKSIQQEELPTDKEVEKIKQQLSEMYGEEYEGLEDEGYDSKDLATLFTTLTYNRITDLPDLFLPIANVRLGSSYEGLKAVKDMMENFVKGNPHIFVAFLGNVIDQEVPGKEDRRDVLDQLVSLVELVGSEQVLAILLDSVMRDKKWRKKVGYSSYVPPGTYLSDETSVPLVAGGSVIEIAHGPQKRTDRKHVTKIGILDGQKRLGSYSKALMGLASYYQNHDRLGMDVLVTGHHPHAGAGTYHFNGKDVNLIDVGHFSPFDNRSGSKNVQQTAEAGQSVIIDGADRFIADDLEKTMELFNAIFAYAAAKKYGMLK